jgi:thiamine-phosphate diphosphorylase
MELIREQLRLYLVTDPDLCAAAGVLDTVHAAVQGGVTMVQLRDKLATTAARIEMGRALLQLLDGSGVPLIVNDDIDAAMAIGAHGVHVGQSDMRPHEVRARVGPTMIVGWSCETVAHAAAADPHVVDYVGLGPVFPTTTKPDHAEALGLHGLAAARTATTLPSVAIGGVQLANGADVLASGVDGLAVISAICGQPHPGRAARTLADLVMRTRTQSFSPRTTWRPT